MSNNCQMDQQEESHLAVTTGLTVDLAVVGFILKTRDKGTR